MNNNISFQGHSTLALSKKAYREASEVATRNGRHLSTKNTCNLSNGKKYDAVADASDIVVIVRNEKDGVLKHVPVNDCNEDILSFISKTVEKLKKTAKESLTAWIIGGDKINGKNGEDTVKTLNKIADVLCDRSDIDASILVGSKAGEDRFFLHPIGGKFELGLDQNIKTMKESKLPDEEKLENFFDVVELNNTDVKID